MAIRNDDPPLLIVGCGRSGTTLVYDMLCGHPDVGWFSNYTDRLPGLPQLAFLNRAYPALQRGHWHPRGAPIPSEGYRLWDVCGDGSLEGRHLPLSADDANPADRDQIRRLMAQHLRYQRRTLFVNKNTRNARRVAYLGALLPEARFLHVLREPRATVSSLLRVSFWPELRVHWRDGRTVRELVADGMPAEVLAAELWSEDVSSAVREGASIGPGRYREVKYEDFLEDPVREIDRILGYAGLPWTDRYERFLRSFSITDRRGDYENRLTAGQLHSIDQLTGPTAQSLGYPLLT